MKRLFIKRTMFFIAAMMLLFAPVVTFAQDTGAETPTEVVNPLDFTLIFGTFAALAAAIPFFVQAIKRLIPNASSLVIQIVSWFTGIAITMFGWLFNLGFLADLTWYIALLYGLGASLAANGVFDTGIITQIISFFFKKK